MVGEIPASLQMILNRLRQRSEQVCMEIESPRTKKYPRARDGLQERSQRFGNQNAHGLSAFVV